MLLPMELHPDFPLVTDRLRLRPPTLDDVPALLAYRSDPEVCRYLPFEPQDELVLRDRLAGAMGYRAITAETPSLTVVAELADGSLAGDVLLFNLSDQHRSGEIGYVFAPAVSGQGYATEACRAVLALAFDGLGLHRVVAQLDARNDRSARLAERLGMRLEAHHAENEWFKGEWSDLLVYAVLDREWRSAGGAR